MIGGKKLGLISQVPFTETAGSIAGILENARYGLLFRIEAVCILWEENDAPGAGLKSYSLRVASGHQCRPRGCADG